MNISITAISPIAHAGYSEGAGTGNLTQFRKMPIVCGDGAIHELPVVSGNAVRGIMRRKIAMEFFDRLELRSSLADIRPGVYDRLYTVIGIGGTLGSDLEKAVDPERIREIRKNLPMLSLFGAAVYKYMIRGMMDVGFAILDCAENGNGDFPARELLTDIGQVRHVDGGVDKEKAEIKPMPYIIEAVVAGATFSSQITTAPQITPLEVSCLHHAVLGLKTLGGKASAGFGQVSIKTDEALDDSQYLSWLNERDDDYIEWVRQYAEGI